MIAVTTLLRSALVTVFDVRCDGHDSKGLERPVGDVVVLARRGAFTITHGGREVLADANRAVMLRTAEPYGVRHRALAEDRSTALAPSPFAIDTLGRSRRGDPGQGRADILLPSDLDLAHRRLVHRLATNPDPLALEELALGIVADLLDVLEGGPTTRSGDRPPNAGQRRLAMRAAECLHAADLEPRSLADLAAEVGASPYHLCRIFRRVHGLTLGRYRLRLRVRDAVERLLGGEESVARVAQDAGFADQSHLVHALRAEVGATPTELRRQPASAVASWVATSRRRTTHG